MNNQIKEQLENVIHSAIADQQLAGMNLLILKENEEKLYLNCGYADRANHKEIQRDTIFRLFSMTKPITSAAVMILFQRGLIDLTDPVSKYISSFENQMVAVPGGLEAARNPVTIQNLLSMTGGLTYDGYTTAAETATQNVFDEVHARMHSDNPVTTLEFAEKIGQCPLKYHPGTGWKYSVSADILGAIVEKVSGVSFGEFLREEIFDPLGINDTGFYVPEEKRHRLAVPYQCTENGLKEFHVNYLGICMAMNTPPAYEAGGAGLVSTIDDYARFTSMLLNRGTFHGKQVLLPATVDYMVSRRLTPEQQQSFDRELPGMLGYSYGNLLRTMTDPWKTSYAAVSGEYGWDGWLGCYFTNIPSENMTILMMMQRCDTGTIDLTRKLRNIILLNL